MEPGRHSEEEILFNYTKKYFCRFLLLELLHICSMYPLKDCDPLKSVTGDITRLEENLWKSIFYHTLVPPATLSAEAEVFHLLRKRQNGLHEFHYQNGQPLPHPLMTEPFFPANGVCNCLWVVKLVESVRVLLSKLFDTEKRTADAEAIRPLSSLFPLRVIAFEMEWIAALTVDLVFKFCTAY